MSVKLGSTTISGIRMINNTALSPIQLLNTITVSENVRGVNIDFSDYVDDYDFIYIYEDVELTQSDWLYYSTGQSSATGGAYDLQTLVHKGVCAVIEYIPANSTKKVNAVGNSAGGLNNVSSVGESTNRNIYVYTYVATKYIKAGSIFKIYGGNYENM